MPNRIDTRWTATCAVAAVVAALAGVAACGDDGGPTGPGPLASIEVTSPIGSLLAVGRNVQLEATARDADGDEITDASFSWNSSNPSAATVGSTGLVQGVGAGNTSITATADGVSGDLALRVVAADLSGVQSLLSDPFTESLVTNLTSTERQAIESALADCETAIPAGDLELLRDCLIETRQEAETALDDNDRALLAVLDLILAQAQRLLNL